MNAAIAALQEAKVKATQSGVSTEYSGRRRTLAEIRQAEKRFSTSAGTTDTYRQDDRK